MHWLLSVANPSTLTTTNLPPSELSASTQIVSSTPKFNSLLPDLPSSAPGPGTVERSHVSGNGKRLESYCKAAPTPSSTTAKSDNMARLQSGTKSVNKPRLMSRVSPDPLQTPTHGHAPTRVSLMDQYNAVCGPQKPRKWTIRTEICWSNLPS